jgi:hypothetical protein
MNPSRSLAQLSVWLGRTLVLLKPTPRGGVAPVCGATCRGEGVCDLPLLQLLGEDLPGAVVVRAESEGPPEEDRFDEESPVKVADESRPLRFAVWEAYQSSPASAHITVQGV